MSKIKLVSKLNMGEVENICNNVDGCAECPLLISSYKKEIHCLKDNTIRIYEIEKAYNILNSEINLETNKLVEK